MWHGNLKRWIQRVDLVLVVSNAVVGGGTVVGGGVGGGWIGWMADCVVRTLHGNQVAAR